jgi:hypothetical protein
VIVEFVVRDRRQAAVTDLKATELELRQDGEAQAVASLEPGGGPGAYRVRYVPKSGRPGPLMLRVLRPGATASGPDGGPLKVRVEAALKPLERRLLALLGAAEAVPTLEHRVSILRFERDGERVHHTFVVEVPLTALAVNPAGAVVRGTLGLLAQVKTEGGELVHRFSLEYPIETPADERERLRGERVVWTSHLHLPPGRYLLETAAADVVGSAGGALRTPFEAPPATSALRLSSVVVLAEAGALAMDEAAADNPLRLDARQLVPARHPRFVSGRDEPLAFYMVVYPDATRPEPPEASLELYRAGALVARGTIALPARAGTMPYVGSFPVGKLPPADYEMKVVVRQGAAIAMESATFEMCCRDAGGS